LRWGSIFVGKLRDSYVEEGLWQRAFRFVALLAGICGVGLAPRLEAQVTTATILGTVTDMSGAAVPGAVVQVKTSEREAPSPRLPTRRGDTESLN